MTEFVFVLAALAGVSGLLLGQLTPKVLDRALKKNLHPITDRAVEDVYGN